MKIENFPNLPTEIICSLNEGVALTVSDIKGALQTGISLEPQNVYCKLIQASIDTIDWDFVQLWLDRPASTELITL